MAFFLKNMDSAIEFDEKNGTILGIARNGKELAYPASELFRIQLLDRSGDARMIHATEFAYSAFDGIAFVFSGHPGFPELKVAVKTASAGRFFQFRTAVTGIDKEHVLEWIDSPVVCVSASDTLFQPVYDGTLITDPFYRNCDDYLKYHPIAFAKRGIGLGSFFPGCAQMQFLAHYGDGGGIYYGAHDPACGTKAVEYEPFEDGHVRLSLQTFTGCGYGESYESPFDYVVGTFDGGWMRACSFYRDWVESLGQGGACFPTWLEKSPVLVIYPIRGHGFDMGEMTTNEYYPYASILPLVRKFNSDFDSAVMPLLMHWEGTAPWAPPYVWPPFGGEQMLAELRDGLHKDGNLLGLYCSGTAWTQTSSITDYSCEKRFEKEGLERYMLRGPKGEIDAVVCNGKNLQRLGYDLCLTEDWSRKTILDEIMKLARFGVDYAQFFDQNLGGGFNFCYSRQHHHPPVPGIWQTETMTSILEEAVEKIHDAGSDMILGCEASAAHPYCALMLLNDARPNLWGGGKPVPAQSFVFHGITNCFCGNQGAAANRIDHLKCPWNLLYRTAYAFNAGDLLSVMLKDGGRFHWGWVLGWDFQEPDQKSMIHLIRNLNAIRKKYPQFLLHGKMLEPLAEVTGEKWIMKLRCEELVLDSFLYSSWQAQNGEKAMIVTNFLPEEQTVFIDGKATVLPPLDAIVIL